VLPCHSRNISQKGRNRLRRSNKVYKHRGFRHRHTRRDSHGWQHCVAIPFAKHLVATMGKVGKVKECVAVDREQKEDGRRLDRFYVIICINAMQLQVQFFSHFLPVSSGFHFHTRAFRSLLCVFIAQTTSVHDVTPASAASRILRSSGAGSHLLRMNLHLLLTKMVETVGKVKYCGPIHTLWFLPDHGGDVCKVWFRSVQKCGFV
jgi:hypothetical protein